MNNAALEMENQRLESELAKNSPAAIQRIEIWNDQLIREKDQMMGLINAKEQEIYNIDNELRNQIDVSDRLVAQLRGTIAELDAKLKKSHQMIEEKRKED